MPSLHSVALGCATVTALGLLSDSRRRRHGGGRRAAPAERRKGTGGGQAAGRRTGPAGSELLGDGHPARGTQPGERHGPGAQPSNRGLGGAPVPESPGGAGANGRGVPRRPRLARRRARAAALHDAVSRQSARDGRHPRGRDARRTSRRRLPRGPIPVASGCTSATRVGAPVSWSARPCRARGTSSRPTRRQSSIRSPTPCGNVSCAGPRNVWR